MIIRFNQIGIAIFDLNEKKKQAQLEFDYQSFLFNELDEASLKKGEYEEIEEELNTLSNADEIMQHLAITVQKVANEESGALDLLTEARAALSRISGYGAQYQSLHDRIHSVLLELEDVSSTLTDVTGQIEADPVQLERLNTRVQLLHNLIQKHQVHSLILKVTGKALKRPLKVMKMLALHGRSYVF